MAGPTRLPLLLRLATSTEPLTLNPVVVPLREDSEIWLYRTHVCYHLLPTDFSVVPTDYSLKNPRSKDNFPTNTLVFFLPHGDSCPSMTQTNPYNLAKGSLINPDDGQRASRYQRPKPIPMLLTDRDEQLIARCWGDKLLSTSDLHTLFFGAKARCIYRLRILYSNYYLDRYFFPVISPYRGSTEALYTIGTKGSHIVSLRMELDQNYIALKRREFNTRMQSPSFLLTFRHLRTVNHTRIRFEQAFDETQDWQLIRWIPERLLEDQFTITHAGQLKRTKIRPDGFLQYQHTTTGQTYSAFVEADLGTMSHQQIRAKVKRYLHYFQTDLPHQKYGTHWFRVLILTPSQPRARQLWRTISHLCGSIFWLTSFDAMKDPSWLTERIWLRVGHEGNHALVE